MFAELVGRENVIAGTDCSRVPSANRLGQAPALCDGAATASKKLWN
jgi:hypothetical protein